jgi:hypothetical protein
MQTKPLPEIADSDLKAVRHFLTSLHDEPREARELRPDPIKGAVPLRIGITRVRTRSAARREL